MVALARTLSKTPFWLTLCLVFTWVCVLSETTLGQDGQICPNFRLVGNLSPGLSEMERRLVCGDSLGPEGWIKIPLNQAEFLLRNFLQERGYFAATFQREGDALVVFLGEPTTISSLAARGAPPELDLERRRKTQGALLTPAFLDELEGWAKSELQSFGYACPDVQSEANPETGEVALVLKPGKKMKFVEVREEPIERVEPWTLRRFDAFRTGDEYDGRWVSVTENRITALDILQSVTLSTVCTPEGAVIIQRAVPGPPRLLTFRFGLNTEEYFLTKISWRNTRLGPRASWLDVTGRASFRIQSLTSALNWFHLPYSSRRSIRPTVELKRQSEKDSETLSVIGQLAYGSTWDLADIGGDVRVGPTLELFHRVRGPGEADSRFLALDARAEMKSHSFEYYAASPRTGFTTTLSLGLSDQDLWSSVSAQRINWSGQFLLNVAEFNPPFLVLGVRSRVNTTITQERPGIQTKLPVPYLYFLGGSQDIRGFGRRELPDTDGALTSAYVGFEARLVATLPAGIEPILFVDTAKYGKRPMNLDSNFFWAPGGGIRWQSPFGTIRFTAAHGFEAEVPRHWQFFFSFGEEF
jgi:translocation and assembly module TamA